MCETLAERIARLRSMAWGEELAIWPDETRPERLWLADMEGISFGYFDPENDWAQCGVLLEELVQSKGLFGACDLLHEAMLKTFEADEENVKPAICEAWCAMKEAEA